MASTNQKTKFPSITSVFPNFPVYDLQLLDPTASLPSRGNQFNNTISVVPETFIPSHEIGYVTHIFPTLYHNNTIAPNFVDSSNFQYPNYPNYREAEVNNDNIDMGVDMNIDLENGFRNDFEGIPKSPQYSLTDDLLILKTINSYYGTAFHGRVPWSFWQTFRKTTGNRRSSSSLYHHWNGAMKRKYGSFLSQGRLTECIQWIETAIESAKPMQRRQIDDEYTGMPLQHNWSLPPVPIKANTEEIIEQRRNSNE
ncbi:hypothetical protein TRFO_11367 [Tritrichomonas foetus]|uniref:Myb-like domain-containing protein n=1 Tax=Tritrichomonas foetus TaxID=1144522 RepID=A0A1J4J8T5_9EUKA|nr:hypothetical protein TRFO_11367 [Tritrichomonas foetus]|eukprot:OHS94099.1 hypothetical protein TRFO_11367 [Tritrichomonas foetus]